MNKENMESRISKLDELEFKLFYNKPSKKTSESQK